MNPYELKQALRKQRQADSAEKWKDASNALFDAARRSIEHIPPGQPILVGHYSERRHRRDLARHDRLMRKAIEAQKRGEEMARRSTTTNNAISADDPDATDKLAEKIAKLKRNQEIMVAANKVYRSKLSDDEKVAKLVAIGVPEDAARGGLLPDYAGRIGIPSYALTNNNANIRRLEQRLAALTRVAAEPEREDYQGNGFTIKQDKEENRLMVVFDAIPPRDLRTKLKTAGFKWSPNRGAWVRMLNNGARHAACYALGIEWQELNQ